MGRVFYSDYRDVEEIKVDTKEEGKGTPSLSLSLSDQDEEQEEEENNGMDALVHLGIYNYLVARLVHSSTGWE